MYKDVHYSIFIILRNQKQLSNQEMFNKLRFIYLVKYFTGVLFKKRIEMSLSSYIVFTFNYAMPSA